MCGIFGCIWSGNSNNKINSSIDRAFKLLTHRGPDNQTLIKNKTWAIGHTRLSIIDISSKANQPFTDKFERYYLSFNGEIYNYKELRKKLEKKGILFETDSDTEVLFKLLIHEGLEKTLKKIEGMFAFFLFDKVKKTLIGARDHFGQKPVYYSQSKNFFSIASEVPPLLELQNKIECDFDVWQTYLCSNGIIDPNRTFFKNIQKLPAGHSFELREERVIIKKYFDVLSLHDNNARKNNYNESLDNLDYLLNNALRKHTISDVPIGVLLSGGIDSSLVMKYALNHNLNLKAYTKISPNIENIPQEVVPKLVDKYSIDCEYIVQEREKYLEKSLNYVAHSATPAVWGGGPPMANICKKASSDGFKVLLGGDGVDEYACGYNTHQKLFDNFNGDMFKLHSIVDLDRTSQFYDENVFEFIQNRISERSDALSILSEIKDDKERFCRAVLFQDLGTFLQTCNLPHSDTYSMLHSVELRNPLLDLDLIKFITNLPIDYRYNFKKSALGTKRIFRKLAVNKIGDFVNVKKEGTRNFSTFIANEEFWNLDNFKILDIFPLKKSLDNKTLFKLINLEFLLRSSVLKEEGYLPELLSREGLNQNIIQ